jgi:exodeoxyribonuclease VII small subunit
MDKEKLVFEDGMKRLEEIVLNLEKGSVPLESSMELFTEGTKLSADLQKILDEAESKIKIITEKNGKFDAEDFDATN